MSIVVALHAGAERNARAAQQKQRLRRRIAAVLGTSLLVLGMAAVPLPVWETSENLSDRAAQLRTWIEEARREERSMAAFRAAGGEQSARDVTAQLAHWLLPHDPVETRNLLVDLARAGGLLVDDVQVVRDDEPLRRNLAPQRATTVLGAAVALDAPRADAGTTLLPVAADRFTLSGRGTLPALLLFCGVVREMPLPLRLRSVRVDAAEGGYRFRVIVEKLLDATRDNGAAPEMLDV